MLTICSGQGSPGASTTAVYIAALWASMDREVLLIEADPAGGSLSHHLGIQFTPGSASLIASGSPIVKSHLIDHSQDVLFEHLHILPAPPSPMAAKRIVKTLANHAEKLRKLSENEMAVIVDLGRITANPSSTRIMLNSAAVTVVLRPNSNLSNLDHLQQVVTMDPAEGKPVGSVVTIGKSLWTQEEWQEHHGLLLQGSIAKVPDMTGDLSAFLTRKKRKSRKWRRSLEVVGERLFEYAMPTASSAIYQADNNLRSLLAEDVEAYEVTEEAYEEDHASATVSAGLEDSGKAAGQASAESASGESSGESEPDPPEASQSPTPIIIESSPAPTPTISPSVTVQTYHQMPQVQPNPYGQAAYGQSPDQLPNPYGQAAYGQSPDQLPNPYGQAAYGQSPDQLPNPYGQAAYGQSPDQLPNPYGQAAYGQSPDQLPNPYGQAAYGQSPDQLPNPYGQAAYGQSPDQLPNPYGQAAYGQSPDQLPNPYGQAAYGQSPDQLPNPYGQAAYTSEPASHPEEEQPDHIRVEGAIEYEDDVEHEDDVEYSEESSEDVQHAAMSPTGSFRDWAAKLHAVGDAAPLAPAPGPPLAQDSTPPPAPGGEAPPAVGDAPPLIPDDTPPPASATDPPTASDDSATAPLG